MVSPFCLLQDMNVFLRADVLEDLWPHRYTHLAQMGCAQQVHVRPGLPDAAPDTQWNLIVEKGLMVGQAEKILLARHLELDLERFLGDPDAHRGQLVAPFCDRIPHQDITVKSMVLLAIFDDGLGDPVVVIGSAHFVGVAVFQRPADADNEYRRGVFHKGPGLPLFAW